MGMRPGISYDVASSESAASDRWLPNWPNPADFRFNYWELLRTAADDGIARVPAGRRWSVAIVGAGVAGMSAARELHRCGFDVTVIEASDRIGGRLFTVGNPRGDAQAGMEMGAMRMPFFSQPGAKNSILEYYLLTEPEADGPDGSSARLTPFPNPGKTPDGAGGIAGTGIYVNRGLGSQPKGDTAAFIDWRKGGSPDDTFLSDLNDKVVGVLTRFTELAEPIYLRAGDEWPSVWAKIVAHYDPMAFNDLVVAPAKDAPSDLDDFDGDLGGFGMTPEEATMLYTIGVGDGSWGAFYAIGALWFIRCTFFGFSTDLQTVEEYGNKTELPHYLDSTVRDSAGHPIPPPRFEGIQALVEYLFFIPPHNGTSLFESERAELYLETPVSGIERIEGAGVEVAFGSDRRRFDFALVTTTTWAGQVSIRYTGFSEKQLPQRKRTASATQHNISSCKLFFPLKTKYWTQEGNRIPQIVITDTFVQDVYGLSWTSKPNADAGVLLASYTWEDDSLKLLPFDQGQLAEMVKEKLDEITMRTVQQKLSDHIDDAHPVMFQWIDQPTYIGCAKLYRAYAEADNLLDLSYNQNFGGDSHLYFAGENYGVEGGWTEPALRSSLDAVIQLLRHVGADFVDGFDPAEDYPRWRDDPSVYGEPSTF